MNNTVPLSSSSSSLPNSPKIQALPLLSMMDRKSFAARALVFEELKQLSPSEAQKEVATYIYTDNLSFLEVRDDFKRHTEHLKSVSVLREIINLHELKFNEPSEVNKKTTLYVLNKALVMMDAELFLDHKFYENNLDFIEENLITLFACAPAFTILLTQLDNAQTLKILCQDYLDKIPAPESALNFKLLNAQRGHPYLNTPASETAHYIQSLPLEQLIEKFCAYNCKTRYGFDSISLASQSKASLKLMELLKNYVFTPDKKERWVSENPIFDIFYRDTPKSQAYQEMLYQKLITLNTHLRTLNEADGVGQMPKFDTSFHLMAVNDLCVWNYMNGFESESYFEEAKKSLKLNNSKHLVRSLYRQAYQGRINHLIDEMTTAFLPHVSDLGSGSMSITFFSHLSIGMLEKIDPDLTQIKNAFLKIPAMCRIIRDSAIITELEKDAVWVEKFLTFQPKDYVHLSIKALNGVQDPKIIEETLRQNVKILHDIENPAWYQKDIIINAFSDMSRTEDLKVGFFRHLQKKGIDVKSLEFYENLIKATLGESLKKRTCQEQVSALMKLGLWDKWMEVDKKRSPEEVKAFYNQYLCLLNSPKIRNFNLSVFPIVLLEDVDYCIECCEKYPALRIKELISDKLVFSRKFSLYLLDQAQKKANGSESLYQLSSHLPEKIVSFFKKSGIEQNCVTFLKSYFEKKDLNDLLSPPKIHSVNLETKNQIVGKTTKVTVIPPSSPSALARDVSLDPSADQMKNDLQHLGLGAGSMTKKKYKL